MRAVRNITQPRGRENASNTASWSPTHRFDDEQTQTRFDDDSSRMVVNNGVMLAAPNATFMRMWRELYREFDNGPDPKFTKDGYFSCMLPYRLYKALPGLAHMRAEIGPLPAEVRACRRHMAIAPVWHITGMSSQYFRKPTLLHAGVLDGIFETLREALGLRRHLLTDEQVACVERAVREVTLKYPSVNKTTEYPYAIAPKSRLFGTGAPSLGIG